MKWALSLFSGVISVGKKVLLFFSWVDVSHWWSVCPQKSTLSLSTLFMVWETNKDYQTVRLGDCVSIVLFAELVLEYNNLVKKKTLKVCIMPRKVQKRGMTTHSQGVANIPPTPAGSLDGEDREEETITPVQIEVTIANRINGPWNESTSSSIISSPQLVGPVGSGSTISPQPSMSASASPSLRDEMQKLWQLSDSQLSQRTLQDLMNHWLMQLDGPTSPGSTQTEANFSRVPN